MYARLASLASALLWNTEAPIVCLPPTRETQGVAVAAFCGTQNWRDLLLDDLDIRPAPWPPSSTTTSRVHGGFARRTRRLLKEKQSFFEAHDRFLLTGHSLGGSCSILCAAELAARGKAVHSVITFGTPYLASRKFQRTYAEQELWRRTTNYFTPRDPIVTRIPHFYRRAGRYVRIDYNGTDPWDHHDIQTYHALLDEPNGGNTGGVAIRGLLASGASTMGTNLS